jgi:hypothetical protein
MAGTSFSRKSVIFRLFPSWSLPYGHFISISLRGIGHFADFPNSSRIRAMVSKIRNHIYCSINRALWSPVDRTISGQLSESSFRIFAQRKTIPIGPRWLYSRNLAWMRPTIRLSGKQNTLLIQNIGFDASSFTSQWIISNLNQDSSHPSKNPIYNHIRPCEYALLRP